MLFRFYSVLKLEIKDPFWRSKKKRKNAYVKLARAKRPHNFASLQKTMQFTLIKKTRYMDFVAPMTSKNKSYIQLFFNRT